MAHIKIFFSVLVVVFLNVVFCRPVLAGPQDYRRCQPSTDCIIGEYVFDNSGTPIITSICTIDVRDPIGTLIVNDAAMIPKDDGWHYYTANIASPEGLYRALITCNNSGDVGYLDKSFVLGTSFENVDATIWSYTSRSLSSFGTLVADIWSSLTSGMTTSGSIGKLLADNVNTSIGTLASDVWSYTTRTLTSTLVGTKDMAGTASDKADVSGLATKTSITDLGTKIDSLKTLASINRQLVEKIANAPQIKVWYEKGSIILKAEIRNPSTSLAQVVEFKQKLPREVKPEHIVNLDGLEVEYDSVDEVYYLWGEFRLTPQETIAKSVKIKNVWQIADSEIANLKKNATQVVGFLKGSSYFAQGSILTNDINARLDSIKEKQEKAITPEENITVYRENLADLGIAKKNFETLNGLVLAWEGEKKVIANIGGIQITATWGIILAVVVGLGLLGLTNLYLLGSRGKYLLPVKVPLVPLTPLKVLAEKIVRQISIRLPLWIAILVTLFTYLLSSSVLKIIGWL